MKTWKPFEDECDRCGCSPVDILTSADNGFAYDGDSAQCFECGLCGCISCDENDNGDGIAWVVWDDYEDKED